MLDLAIVSVRRLLGDRKGISAIEYGVLGAVIVVAISAAALTVNGAVGTSFSSIVSSMASP
jgi:Flp pilus assembly pilin Flp